MGSQFLGDLPPFRRSDSEDLTHNNCGTSVHALEHEKEHTDQESICWLTTRFWRPWCDRGFFVSPLFATCHKQRGDRP